MRSLRLAVFAASASRNCRRRRSALNRSCFHHLAASAFSRARVRSLAFLRSTSAAVYDVFPSQSSSSSNAYEFDFVPPAPSPPGRRRQFAFDLHCARYASAPPAPLARADDDDATSPLDPSYARLDAGFFSTSYAWDIKAKVWSSERPDDATSGWCSLASLRYARLISDDVAVGETPRTA